MIRPVFSEEAPPVFSVVMAAYNASSTISDSIESVLAQSFYDFELIICDDCSKDDTLRVVERFSDPRIKVIKNKSNSGTAISRNACLRIATGQLVAFLDSDDIWGRDVLSLHYSAHDTARVGISYGSYQTIDTQGRVIGRFSPPAQVDIESMLKSCDIGLLTACVNRKVAGDFSFPETPKEDYALWVVLLQRPGVTAVRVSGLQCYYRIRSGSVSSNKTAEIFRQWKVIRAYGNCGPWSALVNIVFYGLKGLKKNILDYRRSR